MTEPARGRKGYDFCDRVGAEDSDILLRCVARGGPKVVEGPGRRGGGGGTGAGAEVSGGTVVLLAEVGGFGRLRREGQYVSY